MDNDYTYYQHYPLSTIHYPLFKPHFEHFQANG